jgi:asparagine synthetase B (glutamine-hydrolysing)
MCGISGILAFNKDFLEREEMENFPLMLNSISHRGPDGWGIG